MQTVEISQQPIPNNSMNSPSDVHSENDTTASNRGTDEQNDLINQNQVVGFGDANCDVVDNDLDSYLEEIGSGGQD